ncbi:hypothetical protein SBRY_10490 [Actinacidiphila bryophytorum]|uniref:Uncharacterized protein n=1 Tax=Actinacidiphila bryophytorum TaxID=1436133 RepID=A0A9W4EC69_9ACTN|nr:hypothetical protein SBRY_10490 [Actinacidiphila bryophytorum]
MPLRWAVLFRGAGLRLMCGWRRVGATSPHRPVARHGPNSPFGSVTTRAPGGGWARSSPRP